ncbi:MAG TPA: MgtC/SapB family protein [Acidobacteriaceae bacterium]
MIAPGHVEVGPLLQVAGGLLAHGGRLLGQVQGQVPGPAQPGRTMHFSDLEQVSLTASVASRLLLAAGLGAVVGLERALHHKAAGVRTNLLICFGAAMFTFLSPVLAGALGNNKGQIAANVVQGIGFLGAGLILHTRDRVNGLTSAATVFSVASIGMACGAGLHLLAMFATAVVLLSLEGIGYLEQRVNLKAYSLIYEVRARHVGDAETALLAAMDRLGRRLTGVEQDTVGTLTRLSFEVSATRRGHQELMEQIGGSPAIDRVLTFRSVEED